MRLLIQHGDPSDAGAALLSLALCEPLVCARNRTLDYADAATFVDDGAFDDAAAQNRRHRAGRAERPRARRHALHPVGAAIGAASLRSRLGDSMSCRRLPRSGCLA